MIGLCDARKIAGIYYQNKGNQEIVKVYETKTAWIVFGGRKGMQKIGGAAINIDKASGDVSTFVLPSKENFEILKNAKLINIEEE